MIIYGRTFVSLYLHSFNLPLVIYIYEHMNVISNKPFSAWVYPVVSHWGWHGGNEGCYTDASDTSTLVWADCNDEETISIPMGNKTVDCYECQSHGAGWLVDLGYNDFAGSGIVHLLGGTCALVGCIFIGPRKGRFTKDGVPIDMPGHSVPLAALGGFILLFGFLAFNGGSQVRSSNNISNVLNDNQIRSKIFLDLMIIYCFL